MGTLPLGWQFQPPSTAADASSNDAVVFYHVQVVKCLILSYVLQGEGIWDLILLWALLEEWLELWGDAMGGSRHLPRVWLWERAEIGVSQRN